jgi:hypothetical protein
MTNDNVQGMGTRSPDYPGEPPDEMSQEEQARLLVEPTFDHRVEDEADLLRDEFGPPDESGGYGRGDDYVGGRAES